MCGRIRLGNYVREIPCEVLDYRKWIDDPNPPPEWDLTELIDLGRFGIEPKQRLSADELQALPLHELGRGSELDALVQLNVLVSLLRGVARLSDRRIAADLGRSIVEHTNRLADDAGVQLTVSFGEIEA